MKTRTGILLHFLFLLLIISCSGINKKIKKKDIIPEKDLVSVLVDIHIADGIFDIPSVLHKFPGKDSLSNYQDIMKSHGYKLSDLDKTIKYYSRKPDKLEIIYDKVQNKLSQMESEIRNRRYSDQNIPMNDDLWNQKTEWHLPLDGKQNAIQFSIPIKNQGLYTLNAELRIFPDDQSLNPRVTAYFWFDDGSELGKRIFFASKKISKTGTFATYTLSQMTKNPEITHLKGWILDHSSKPTPGWAKHADVKSINVAYKPISPYSSQKK